MRIPGTRACLLALLLLTTWAGGGCDRGTDSGQRPVTPCSAAVGGCTSRLAIGGGLYVRYYRTHPLETGSAEIVEAIILIHGAGRAADWNFETGVLAARMVNRTNRTLVIAPRFPTADDDPAPDEAYWTSGGWKRGHLSVQDATRTHRVSSYAVLEQFIRILDDDLRFPNLESIVVAGHSAGGQYTHRFAAGNRVEQQLTGVEIRYVVANPSTYLYLGPERAIPGTLDRFAVPSSEQCPDYNEWHYGLEGLNTYMSALSIEQIQSQLVTRNVTIMVGTEDRGTAQLDMSCGAMLQGSNRYYRGLTLVNYMDAFWPGHNHTLVAVAGVAHSSREMFTSTQGLSALFRPLGQRVAAAGRGP